nr:DNA recombination protein RmuC [Alphaproteobacteria bacterium]
QARGAFGEVQLVDLVSQVLPASHYEIQATLSNNRRADCLLKLPNPPGPIVVDAKFPLESYNAMLSAAGDEARLAAAKLFERDVRKHVRDIAERYLIPGETADQALMFLPSEAIYAELHTQFLGVVEEARRARVHIVSPNTFWALLTSVRAVLKDVQLREQTHLLQAEIAQMLGDVERLDDRVGKLERHFSQATEDIRLVRISADKVTKRGARIGELDLNEGAGDAIEPALPTEAQLKLVDAGADRAE